MITETSKKITPKAVDECKMKFYPIHSVVIAMYGATIGKVGLLDIETATNQLYHLKEYAQSILFIHLS